MEDIVILQRIMEIERGRYSKSSDYSVTDLINPPRAIQLRNRYPDAKKPIASSIASLMGTAMHEYIEKCLRQWMIDNNRLGEYVLEEQVSHDFTIKGETRKVSGRYDIRFGSALWDVKTTKVWKKIFDPELKEWVQQQNLYAYLCSLNGIEIDSLNILCFYKDWTEGSALRDPTYPQEQVVYYELPLWSLETTKRFLYDRLALHVAAENKEDDFLPACSREERWERFPEGHNIAYAIMKHPRAKRAAKVFKGGSVDAAISHAAGMPGITNESFIEVRYAQRTRCKKYCDAAEKCNDYLAYKRAEENGTLNDIIPLR